MVKVLIVDDKIENRDVLRGFFRLFGRKAPIEILEASTGREAVEMALEEKPDLVFMDINMETKHAGLEATTEIKSKTADGEIQIWAITSQAMKERNGESSDERKCLEAGCDRFFSKPFDQKELLYEVAGNFNLQIPERMKSIME
jgi:CheY-like chemotaxis protein